MGESTLNLDPWQFMQHFACFDCRKAFKPAGEFVLDAEAARIRRQVECPDCGRTMVPMGRQFRAPRRASVRALAQLAEVAAASTAPLFERARAHRREPKNGSRR